MAKTKEQKLKDAGHEAEAAANGSGDRAAAEATIEELAENGGAAEEPKPTPPMQIPIPGTAKMLNDVAGGSQPTISEARLLGGSMPIIGGEQYNGEEIVTLEVRAKVGAVETVYTSDDWGQTKAVKRRHKLRMISVKPIEVR